MTNFKLERQYDNYLNLSGAIEHFCDDICEKLNCNIEDDKVIESDIICEYHEEILFMDNGIKLEIEINFNDEAQEWECVCRQL